MASALNKPRIIEHVNQSLTWVCYDAKWIPSSARFAALGNYAKGTGTIQIFSMVEGHKVVKIRELETKHSLKCGTFDSSSLEQRHFAVGDFDGNLMVYDLERERCIYHVKAHKSIINSIDGAGIKGGPPEIVTGSRDGCVKVWDVRMKEKPVVSLEPDSNGADKIPDCWSVAFGNSYNDQERVVAAGYDNGDMKIFDLKTNVMRYETNVKNGICSLEFDRKDIKMNKILSATLEGRFTVHDLYCFNAEKGYPSHTEKLGQSSTVWVGKHLPQNRDIFMVCSGSGLCSLYKYKYPQQRVVGDPPMGVEGKVELLSKQSVSTQPIASWDWHRDKEGLAVAAAFDQAIRVIIVTKLDKI